MIFVSIILLWELWGFNLCLAEDHMLEKIENKSEIKYWQNKLVSEWKICLKNGAFKLLIL
jgi:hypothetical protein